MKWTLRQAQVFCALADDPHFARTAQRLGLSQPTVSKELRALERALGATLFSRSRGGSALTSDGGVLLPLAQAVMDAAERFDDLAHTSRRHRIQHVRIAASPSLVHRTMPALLRRLEQAHAAVQVDVIEVDTGGVTPALDEGRADIGIGHHVAAPAGGSVRTIATEELLVIGAEGLLGRRPIADLTRFANVPLLIWPREQSPQYHDALLEVCRSRGLEPLLLLGTSRLSGSRAYLLHEGRAFALAPRDFALSEVHGVRATRLAQPASVPVSLAWMEPAAPAAKVVIAELRRIAVEELDGR